MSGGIAFSGCSRRPLLSDHSAESSRAIHLRLRLYGISHFKGINGSTPNAVSITPMSMNWHDSDHCSSSVMAYLTPVEAQRTNCLILTKHLVTKIKWANSRTVPLKASSVEFASSTNSTARFTALARREVVITGGAIQAPALLILSGIGDLAVLGPLGIKTEIDLKTVGRSLQEQTMNSLGSHGNDFDKGGPGSSDPTLRGACYLGVLGRCAATVFGVQVDLIKNALVVELFYDSGFPDDLGIDMWQLLPFSRSNVKITSTDPFTAPAIRANYFSVGLDLDVQVAGARLSRCILTSPPLNSLSVGETTPDRKIPDDAARGSDAAGQTWIKNEFASVAHPIGTAAMMRRSLGGVVDAQLEIYDTANVRVVDASVVPLQLSAHLSSTLYGVAEKAADLIKAAR
ncbi:GMC oxidoreductase-domain-containing protein [Mycena sanguinolenta]|nr:GMC oxidoreductase-domain-containing protein [Mycena sanguinolenta]